MMEKMSLDDFLNMDDSAQIVSVMDPEVLALRHSASLYRQLMDVWGEANHSMDIWKDYNKRRKKGRYQDLLWQLDAFHKVCCIVYSNPNVNIYAKKTLRIAEWELYDFTLWDNEFRNNAKSVMRWFDQWCYSINYDLL